MAEILNVANTVCNIAFESGAPGTDQNIPVRWRFREVPDNVFSAVPYRYSWTVSSGAVGGLGEDERGLTSATVRQNWSSTLQA
ncbi:hypothetical protein GCM10027562_14760 [Arthrobacter pigmenti]